MKGGEVRVGGLGTGAARIQERFFWPVVQVFQPYPVEEKPCEDSRIRMYATWNKNLQSWDNACTHAM
jgi:hypothetical protein